MKLQFSYKCERRWSCNAFVEQSSTTGCIHHAHELARLFMHESALELPTSTAEVKNLCISYSKYQGDAWLKHESTSTFLNLQGWG